MKLRSIAAIAFAILIGTPAPGFAQASLASYDAMRTALLTIWAELPLTVRNVTLTDEIAAGYGNYTPREGNRFKLGEPIHVYVEVLGYGWTDNGDGTSSELLDADLNLLDADGTTVARQAKFLSTQIVSREKQLERYLNLQATLADFDPGNYTLQYVLHDLAGAKETSFEVPVTLTAE